jgi:hypothetical protein
LLTTEKQGHTKNRIAPRVWAVVVVLVVCQVILCLAAGKKSLRGDVDFRAFYSAGAIVRSGDGARLYDYGYQQQVQTALVGPRDGALPFLYPSFAALPFVPLSVVSYRFAFLLFLAVNLGLLAWTAVLLRPWLGYFREFGWGTVAAFFGCLFGVSIALMQGQISFALLAVYCGAWVLLRKERFFVAGLCLSLGLMKFQIAIPIVLLFCFWRQWRVVVGFLAGALGLAGISFAMIGRAGASSYVQSMMGMTKQTALDPAAARAHYGMFPVDMPNLHGLTFGLSHGAGWGLVLNIVLCCAVLGFAARQRASLLVAVPAAMLVSYHMQPHDLTLLLLPLSFEVDALLRKMQRRRDGEAVAMRGDQKVLLAAMLLLVLPLGFAVMAAGLNYLASLAVCAVMVSAARGSVAEAAA